MVLLGLTRFGSGLTSHLLLFPQLCEGVTTKDLERLEGGGVGGGGAQGPMWK